MPRVILPKDITEVVNSLMRLKNLPKSEPVNFLAQICQRTTSFRLRANMAVYHALLEPEDGILGMDLSQGGHLTHGSPVNFSGILYKAHSYGLNDDERIDMDQVRDLAVRHKPKMIVAGASAYPRVIDFAAFKGICEEIGAYLLVDMAHIAGLVAAGVHPSPVGVADIITSTTHKTLRGPRGHRFN